MRWSYGTCWAGQKSLPRRRWFDTTLNLGESQKSKGLIEIAWPSVTPLGRTPEYNKYTSMISGRVGCELAMVAVFCVLTILLFPSVQGPYSVVNGPVTALQASRAAIHLRIAIMQAAFRSLGNFLASPALFFWLVAPQAESCPGRLPQISAILRC